MRKIYFHGDNTYTVGEESYHLDGKNHNIQCIDGKWIVDGKSMTFAEMIKMGVAVKMTPEETQKNLDDVLQKLGDVRQKMKELYWCLFFLEVNFTHVVSSLNCRCASMNFWISILLSTRGFLVGRC